MSVLSKIALTHTLTRARLLNVRAAQCMHLGKTTTYKTYPVLFSTQSCSYVSLVLRTQECYEVRGGSMTEPELWANCCIRHSVNYNDSEQVILRWFSLKLILLQRKKIDQCLHKASMRYNKFNTIEQFIIKCHSRWSTELRKRVLIP